MIILCLERERKAREEKERNMEQWMDMLQSLQQKEQEMLTAQSMPLRDYLMKFVFPTLTKGLLETARVKPDDPVDFLAEFLFKENPEGRMFDPSYTASGEDMLKTIEDFQEQLGI